ncbi:plasmid pRiA4b ORF-3 family protein [Paraburkholderia guartelaensis]|uniref:plasmid pRiA4b ORF-3 family protein n=1 Tax=Paraburkholderia TaxID=1822464 RepID=UPI0038B97CB7
MDSASSDAPSVLQLRISLRGVSPPVWRRLLIPEQVTSAQLHRVMQLAMGWSDEHLHRFIIRGWSYGGHRDGTLQFLTAQTPCRWPRLTGFTRRYQRATVLGSARCSNERICAAAG